jgi:hypothetical protein
VAAVFGAFLKVYSARTRDLYRIASEGTGVLRAGDIPPDLSGRLAEEAARIAQNVLQMCIRAIDYCAPVGITFGDYLRGIITADHDLNPEDPFGYRLAFVESFRQWGIHPARMQSMSIESLLWPDLAAAQEVRSLFTEEQPTDSPEQVAQFRSSTQRPGKLSPWNLEGDRYATWEGIEFNSAVLWGWLMKGKGRPLLPYIGLVTEDTDPPAPPTVYRSRSSNRVAVEVHSVRTALRRGPRGGIVSDLVVELTQRRRGYFDADAQKAMDAKDPSDVADEKPDFVYRAGCTLLINPVSLEVRRVIRTRGTIADNAELERVRAFLVDGGLEPPDSFHRARVDDVAREPFALLHREEA